MNEEARGIKLSILFGGFIILASSLISLVPQNNKSIAVVISPWAEQNQIANVIASAGGVIKTQDRVHWIAISHNDNPNLIKNLYGHGALLVINAEFVTACFKL